MRDRLLSFFTDKGTLVEPDAVEHILSQKDPMGFVEEFFSKLDKKKPYITMEDVLRVEPSVRALVEKHQMLEKGALSVSEKGTVGRAEDFDSQIEIRKDITGMSTCEGKIEDFKSYFNHRFQTLASLIKARREMRGCMSIHRAKKKMSEMKFVCIVNSVRKTRAGGRIVEVEDEEDIASVFIPASALGNSPVLPDEVIGVIGKPWRNDLIIADAIVRPSLLRKRGFHCCKEPLSVAFIGDTHVGSKAFMHDKWDKFIRWLNNGEELASMIKYIVIPGDVVDGIGIYPRQDEDLCIHDIYEQYEELASLLGGIPEHIKIIISPGNHDAVRPAEPQPSLPKNIQNLFPSNVIFVGNPCTILLHGVEILIYHGRGMDDFVSLIPNLTYERPLDVMKEMLVRRHLAPTYGGKTPIAPEKEDYLILDSVPDIFVTGHVHSVGIEDYRGVKLVNASTWQTQTSYQKMRNIQPITAMVPIINLQTGEARIREF